MRTIVVLALVATACAAVPPRVGAPSGRKQTHAAAQCSVSSDCALVSRSCCGDCGVATFGDVRAVPRRTAESSHVPARCRGVGCRRCHHTLDPRLVPYCARGACHVLDLSNSPLTRCASDADCTMRPRGCCACGEDTWVGVRSDASAAYQSRVCGAGLACPQCVGEPPESVRVVCDEGTCRARGGTLDDLVDE